MNYSIYSFDNIKKGFKKPSTWILLIINIATIITAHTQQWDVAPLIWIYFIQSLIVGFFQCAKIATAHNFEFDGVVFAENDGEHNRLFRKWIPPVLVLAFLLHFGGFHAGYSIWLIPNIPFTPLNSIITFSVLFFVNHLISFVQSYNKNKQDTKKLMDLMGFPYIRILPLHIIIFIAAFFNIAQIPIIFFMILKTFGDILMHSVSTKK